MLAMASGKSENKRAISAGDFRWRSELRESKRSGGCESAMMANAGEDVENFALRRLRVANAIGGQQRQL